MSGPVNQTRDADIDIGKLFSAIWRNKFKIVIGSLIVTALMFVLLSMVSPRYKSEARVLVDSSESVFTRPSGNNEQQQPQFDELAITSQVDILTSSELLLKVAQELDLGSRSEFDSAASMSALSEVFIMLGLSEDPRQLEKEKRVLRKVREKLEVYAREGSRVIVIEFESKDKELAARFPNVLADAYLKLESRASLDSTGQAAEYLSNEIASLQASVRVAENAVADFRAQSGLFESQNNETLATQQLGELSTELSRVRSDRAATEARARSVQTALSTGQSIDSLPDVIASPIVNRLREQQINLLAELAQLQTTLLDNHPDVRSLKSQINDLSSQLRNEAQKVLVALRAEVDIEREREAQLSRELNQLKSASANANSQEVELNALEREAASQRALLESYLIRFREAQARGQVDYAPASARLISSATVALEPTFPKMIPMLAVTFIGTMLLLSMVALLAELFSGRALVPAAGASLAEVSQPEPAPQPVAGSALRTAQAPPARSRHVSDRSVQPDSDLLPLAALAQALMDNGASRAIVVSPEGDAASGASVGLTRFMARHDVRTILMDLTGTGAASQLMVPNNAVGITDLLASKASYAQVIHPDSASNAHVVPVGRASGHEVASGLGRLPMILEALTEAYDLVIVECGETDAMGLSQLVDAGSEVIVSSIDHGSPDVRAATAELARGGFKSLMMLDATTATPPTPMRGRRTVSA
ncbi:MAG: Wzz/FepE/Etk N-terminal domain-containing protein [Ahrensia sp.]